MKNLASLKKPVKTAGKTIAIDSLKLFNILILISGRNTSIEESLCYELTIQPMSLFDNSQRMRKANKALLGAFIKEGTATTPASGSSGVERCVTDGGWFLHQCLFPWTGKTFGEITKSYVNLVLRGTKNTFVFDGIASSPKDHEHERRKRFYSADINIQSKTICTTTKQKFLANAQNKMQFIKLLSRALEKEKNIKVLQANDDADTLIAKTVLELSYRHTVEVKSEDTDIICMLVHHFQPNNKDMTFSTAKADYKIREIAAKLTEKERGLLLFTQSFLDVIQ